MENQELLNDFVEESMAHVDDVEAALLLVEQEGSAESVINRLFRAVHSIKGTAGFFALHNIVNLAHAMESLFGELRSHKLTWQPQVTDVLLAANDILRQLIGDAEKSEVADIEPYIRQITALTAEPMPGQNKESTEQAGNIAADDFAGENQQPKPSLPAAKVDAACKETGQKNYKIILSSLAELAGERHTPAKYIQQAEAIGTVLDSKFQIENLPDGSSEGIFTIIFSTLLDKSLVAFAFELPEEDVLEVKPEQSEENSDNLKLPAEPVTVARTKTSAAAEFAAKANKLTAEKPMTTVAVDAPVLGLAASPSLLEDGIRVNVNLLNELLNVAGEMVLSRNQLLRILAGYRKKIPGLDAVLQTIDHTTTELQGKIMQTRMQPVGNVFHKFPRMTRELARKVGKEVKLVLTGNEVELDKSIIEALGDPLTHLLRNAVDHGIELPELRRQAGKVRAGLITMQAYHEGGYVNIDVCDDGAGLDSKKIGEKALTKGLVTVAELELLSEREILALIFRPGFSTAEQVTDMSGRGVGMDVVRTNIEKLGGTVEIKTVCGQGTSFYLTLPLTVAIIPSLIVAAGGHKFALPQASIQEMIRIKPQERTGKIEIIQGQSVLRLRECLLPLLTLQAVLGFGTANTDQEEIIRVLILKNGSQRFGLVVDVIYDGEEILVKPLPRFLQKCQCYSGVTILGDGKIAVILDPDGIAVQMNLRFPAEEGDKKPVQAETSLALPVVEKNLLLFQCAGPETFAFDMALLARVEEIETERIERIGEDEYLQLRGEALRLLRPEQYLSVSARVGGAGEKCFVLIPKQSSFAVSEPGKNARMGIVAMKIFDTVQTAVCLQQEQEQRKGLQGMLVVNEKITLLLDSEELFALAAPAGVAQKLQEEKGGQFNGDNSVDFSA